MKSGLSDRAWFRYVLIMSAVFAFFSCTVVKHNEETQSEEDGLTFYFQDGSFDAEAYVNDIWDEKVLPVFANSSTAIAEVLDALDRDTSSASEQYGRKAEVESPYTFRVEGSGVVVALNTESAASTIEIDLDNYTGDRKVFIQIGPVIKKSAVRDSLEFVSFGDFTNQLEYAGVSKELNFKVRDNVVSKLDRDNLLGQHIEFSGAFILFPDEPVLITPIIIKLSESND